MCYLELDNLKKIIKNILRQLTQISMGVKHMYVLISKSISFYCTYIVNFGLKLKLWASALI